MADYGLKVSKIGFDVTTAADSDLVYSSKFNGWKILSKGSVALSVVQANVAHGLSFEPAAILYHTYTDLEGNSGKYVIAGFDQMGVSSGGAQGAAYWTTSTNLSAIATQNYTGYYFIFVDPAQTASGNASSIKDYGIKISQPGFDTATAKDSELSMTSRFKTLKVSASGTATASISATTGNGAHNATTTTINVVSTAGFPSSGIIWFEDSVGFGVEAIKYTGTTATSFTGCTRGWLGYGATTHVNGDRVETAYGKATIAHGLAYPPAFSVFLNTGGNARMVPHMILNSIPTGALCTAFVDSTNLEIRLERDDPTIGSAWGTITGSYPFRYYIFLDQIT